MLELVLLIVGIIFFVLGEKSRKKYDKQNEGKDINSGVIFQANTILLYAGFIMIVASILSFFFS